MFLLSSHYNSDFWTEITSGASPHVIIRTLGSLSGSTSGIIIIILTFSWTAVLLAGGEVFEAVGIALAATVIKGFALHGGHVEEVALKEGPSRSLLFREPANLGDL